MTAAPLTARISRRVGCRLPGSQSYIHIHIRPSHFPSCMQVQSTAEGRLGRRFLEEHLLPTVGIACNGRTSHCWEDTDATILNNRARICNCAGHGLVIPTAKNLDALTGDTTYAAYPNFSSFFPDLECCPERYPALQSKCQIRICICICHR